MGNADVHCFVEGATVLTVSSSGRASCERTGKRRGGSCGVKVVARSGLALFISAAVYATIPPRNRIVYCSAVDWDSAPSRRPVSTCAFDLPGHSRYSAVISGRACPTPGSLFLAASTCVLYTFGFVLRRTKGELSRKGRLREKERRFHRQQREEGKKAKQQTEKRRARAEHQRSEAAIDHEGHEEDAPTDHPVLASSRFDARYRPIFSVCVRHVPLPVPPCGAHARPFPKQKRPLACPPALVRPCKRGGPPEDLDTRARGRASGLGCPGAALQKRGEVREGAVGANVFRHVIANGRACLDEFIIFVGGAPFLLIVRDCLVLAPCRVSRRELTPGHHGATREPVRHADQAAHDRRQRCVSRSSRCEPEPREAPPAVGLDTWGRD